MGTAPAGTLHVSIEKLRNHDGLLQVCLTTNPKRFPNCVGDLAAHRLSQPATNPNVAFTGLPSGDYALAVFHDENANKRLDKVMMVPREGYGFSRDAAVRFGPPRFADAAFPVTAGDTQQSLKMRYLL
ncbi:DUF2141 domain-containing protein [Sphingomonas sp. ID0503]|uniref:DUF2141 domain-containing protein n=1 Tax=Sphingomonas sp. ID0503 TaxID=3399691 RepID=UPI003AFAE3CD